MSTPAGEREKRRLNLHLVRVGTRGALAAMHEDDPRDRGTTVAPGVPATHRLIRNQLVTLLADLREQLDSRTRKATTGQTPLAIRSLPGTTGASSGDTR